MKVVFAIPYPDTRVGQRDWSRRFGLNAIYSGKHWSQRKSDAEYWHMLTLNALSGTKCAIFSEPVRITYLFNDRLDLSNHAYIAKMIEDAIKGVLIADDRRGFVSQIVYKWHELDEIRVEVEEMKGMPEHGKEADASKKRSTV